MEALCGKKVFGVRAAGIKAGLSQRLLAERRKKVLEKEEKLQKIYKEIL